MDVYRRLSFQCSALVEKMRELTSPGREAEHFSFRKAELDLCLSMVREIEKELDIANNALAIEWQKKTGRRLVWALWGKRKLR